MIEQIDIKTTPALHRNKRFIVALLLAIIVATVFWSMSRVPVLNEKAQMGLRTSVSSIAFDILLPVADAQPVIERAARSTVNWLYTNWKGMAFGLLFAAAALTILGAIKQRQFRAAWLNTVSGMFFGAPLGVCVNCATPIAQGMYAAGARLETALATLISSPMLNPIVLSMLFTLLPWEMALSNVAAVLLLLGSLPLLVRRFAASAVATPAASHDPPRNTGLKLPPLAVHFEGNETYFAALLAVSKSYSKNLLYIVRLAVPLMLLAGALGALVIELAPFDRLSQLAAGPVALLFTAVFATFLPVPMAFNVIVVMALQSQGMDPGMGAVLLFSLSAFSIYPATIIARFISVRLSLAIAITVVLMATMLGLATTKYFDHKLEQNQRAIAHGLSLGRQSAYRNVIQVCNSLPGELQLQCFSDSIHATSELVAYADRCKTKPEAVDLQSCQRAVKLFAARELALKTTSREPCRKLDTPAARSQCDVHVVLQGALRNHDIGDCDRLGERSELQGCRVQYLTASLLFNPDDSVCKGLQGAELTACKVNARIYRAADMLNFDACNDLPLDAREHCRWAIATTMIGRSNDASGCTQLRSPALQARCNEHLIAWKATRAVSFELCKELATADLAGTCLLRVAGRKISMLLTDYSLALPFEPALDNGPGSATQNSGAAQQMSAPELDWQTMFENTDIKVLHASYEPNSNAGAATSRFSRVAGRDIGISKAWDFRATDFFEPFIIGKGIASGDINNDSWPDLVLATEHGALIYRNIGGRFQLLDVEQGVMQDANLFLVALVDADNDGAQDLFASAYGGTNYLLLNRKNGFEETELISLPGKQRLTLSAGFADIDQDGDMDIVLGNWSSGVEKLFSPESSANVILYREENAYREETLNEIKGETNSVLIADINNDAIPDLLIGNDRPVPDVYYLGTSSHQFAAVSRKTGMVPLTSMFTMSLISADFNNDLRPDIFSTDMTFARSSTEDYCAAIREDDARARCTGILEEFDLFSTGSAAKCSELGSQRIVHECYVAFSIKAARTLKDDRYCENLPQQTGPLYSLCKHIAAPVPTEPRINQDDYLPQVQRNVLLMNYGDHFADEAELFGVASSFWSWNAKAADLDNDGWQDIYVGNGFHFGDRFYEVQANVLYHNIQGRRFEDVAPDWGLDDTINTPSYTYLDVDLDGDVDIIATGVLAPPRVYINQQTTNNSITFMLRQREGNTFAIGATITIEYGGQQQAHQRKEIKLSGGFMSFDNPVAHFGIGLHDSIDSFSIRWPDGHVTTSNVTLKANGFYRVVRK